MNRPIKLLHPLESAPVSDELTTSDPLPPEQIQQKENGVKIKQVSERSTHQAARVARDTLKEMFFDKRITIWNERISGNL